MVRQKLLQSILILIATLISILPKQIKACEIDFEILKNKKAVYDTSDVFITKVNVILTHRSCPVALTQTQFKLEGLKVLGATDWKQISSMKWERKLKIKVIGSDNGKVFINAIRTCNKDGGFGSLKLNATPLTPVKKEE